MVLDRWVAVLLQVADLDIAVQVSDWANGRRMGGGRLRGYGWRSAEWGAAWGGGTLHSHFRRHSKQALANEQKALEMRLEALKAQIEALEKERSENPSA